MSSEWFLFPCLLLILLITTPCFSDLLTNIYGDQYELIKFKDDPLESYLCGLSNGKMIEWFGRTDELPEEIHFLDQNGISYHSCKTKASVMYLDILENNIFTLERELYPSRAMREVLGLINNTNDSDMVYSDIDYVEKTTYYIFKYDDTKEIGEQIIEFPSLVGYVTYGPSQLVVSSNSIFLLYLDSDKNKNCILLKIVNYPFSNLDSPTTVTVEFPIRENSAWPGYKFHDNENLYFSQVIRNDLPDNFDKKYDYYGEVTKVNLYTGEKSLFFKEKNLNSLGIDKQNNILYYQTLFYPPDAEDKYKSCLNFLYKLDLNKSSNTPHKLELPCVAGLWDNHLKQFFIRIPRNTTLFREPYNQGGYYILRPIN